LLAVICLYLPSLSLIRYSLVHLLAFIRRLHEAFERGD